MLITFILLPAAFKFVYSSEIRKIFETAEGAIVVETLLNWVTGGGGAAF